MVNENICFCFICILQNLKLDVEFYQWFGVMKLLHNVLGGKEKPQVEKIYILCND